MCSVWLQRFIWEVNFKCFYGDIYFAFWTRVSPWPGAHSRFCWLRIYLFCSSSARITNECTLACFYLFFFMALVDQSQFLNLCGKYLTEFSLQHPSVCLNMKQITCDGTKCPWLKFQYCPFIFGPHIFGLCALLTEEWWYRLTHLPTTLYLTFVGIWVTTGSWRMELPGLSVVSAFSSNIQTIKECNF